MKVVDLEVKDAKKREEKRELEWKVDDAIEAFIRYKKLTKDEKVRNEVKKELKKRSEDMKNLSDNI